MHELDGLALGEHEVLLRVRLGHREDVAAQGAVDGAQAPGPLLGRPEILERLHVLLEGPAAGGEVEARDGHARREHIRELVHGFGQGTADGDDDLALVVVDLGPGALVHDDFCQIGLLRHALPQAVRAGEHPHLRPSLLQLQCIWGHLVSGFSPFA